MQAWKEAGCSVYFFKKQCTKYIGSFEIFNSSSYENIKVCGKFKKCFSKLFITFFNNIICVDTLD